MYKIHSIKKFNSVKKKICNEVRYHVACDWSFWWSNTETLAQDTHIVCCTRPCRSIF